MEFNNVSFCEFNGNSQKSLMLDWSWISLASVEVWIISIRSEIIKKHVTFIVLAFSHSSKTKVLVEFQFPWILGQSSVKTGLDFSMLILKHSAHTCYYLNVKIWVKQKKRLLETDKVASSGVWFLIAAWSQLIVNSTFTKIACVWSHLNSKKQVLLAQRTSSTAPLYVVLNMFINKCTEMY